MPEVLDQAVGGQHEEPAWFRALACLSPLIALGIVRSILGGLSIGRLRVSGLLTALGVCMLATVLSALLLGYAVVRKRGGRLALTGAISLLCGGWAWQLACYLLLVPEGGIPFAYFERPEGLWAGRMLVPVPVVAVSAGLLVTLALGLWSSWRAGLRLALLSLIGWWLVAWLVFLLPDIAMSFQGYGVFI